VAHAVQRAGSRVVSTFLRLGQQEMSARMPPQHARMRAPRRPRAYNSFSSCWAARPLALQRGITVIPPMRFRFDSRKSKPLRANPKRGIGFEEVQQLFSQPYWLDQRSDVPEQYLAVGWVGDRLYSVIFEFREDEQGEVLHLVTLWRSTKEEIRLYEENS
jgi:uncharacterized DUF497 family protein